MLVMVVTAVTSGRSQEKGSKQPRIQTTIDGSSSHITPLPTQKRKHHVRNTEAAIEQHTSG